MIKNLFFTLFFLSIGIKVYSQLTPGDISDLLVWYKADDNTLSPGSVTQWDDHSGNNFHLEQAVLNQQPTKIENGIGDLPVMRFDGNDFMQRVYGTSYSNPGTVFIIYKTESSANQYVFDGTNSFNGIRLRNGNSVQGLVNGVAIGYAKSQPFDFILNTFVINGTSSQMWENSELKINGNLPTHSFNGITMGCYYGGGGNFVGDIAEFVYFNRALSESEI